MSSDGATRLDSLRVAQLRALVRSVRPDVERVSPPMAQVTVLADGSAWALAAGPDLAAASAATVRLLRVAGAGERHLVVDTPTGDVSVVAARLATLERPPFLWRAEGAALVAVPVPSLDEAVGAVGPPVVAEPDPLPPSLHELAAALARDVPAVRVERDHHGWILTVRGLEIGRLTPGPDAVELALGVGRFDREAHVEVSGPRWVRPGAFAGHVEAIARVAADVVARRRADAPPHPARTLRAERWLRERVLEDPTLVGRRPGWTARRLASPVAPANLQEWGVAPLLADGEPTDGEGAGGELLVCAVGLQPELPFAAAHAWLQAAALAGRVPLRVVVPARDAGAALPGWLAALRPELDARVVAVPDDWMTPAPG